jgi:hypothetical protein
MGPGFRRESAPVAVSSPASRPPRPVGTRNESHEPAPDKGGRDTGGRDASCWSLREVQYNEKRVFRHKTAAAAW